jgi:hypothetical protein
MPGLVPECQQPVDVQHLHARDLQRELLHEWRDDWSETRDELLFERFCAIRNLLQLIPDPLLARGSLGLFLVSGTRRDPCSSTVLDSAGPLLLRNHATVQPLIPAMAHGHASPAPEEGRLRGCRGVRLWRCGVWGVARTSATWQAARG